MLSPFMASISRPAFKLPDPYDIHLWQLHFPLAQPYIDTWAMWLSADEHDRAQRFRRAVDRDRFILSRGGLRYLLAGYLACSPKALSFAYNVYGKPSLADSDGLHFNLAHSQDWVVYGVGHPPFLGVDVEQTIHRQYLDGLIQRCLTMEEQVTLSPTAPARLRGFLQHWTVKEAHLKAIGLGLSYPMTEVQVAWWPEPHLVCPAVTETPTPWTVKLWHPAEDAIAAVCVGQVDNRFWLRSFPLAGYSALGEADSLETGRSL
ncbi:MAG: 4'-phosphopantetheinyl transferase superfamily protein [Leptolyngbya sp. SIO1D8]|nr:4'-phosphopantetheinyl transferase superfamily protein [Leptolyngbya sp. SIO1D8]